MMRAGDVESEVLPQTFVFVPRGVPHRFWNHTDEDCVFVRTWSPAGAEQAWLMAHHLMDKYGATDWAGIDPDELAKLVTISDSVSVIDEHGKAEVGTSA